MISTDNRMITVKDWLASKVIELPDGQFKAFCRKVASSYEYDRVERPRKIRKVCVYHSLNDRGLLEKCLTSFLQRNK